MFVVDLQHLMMKLYILKGNRMSRQMNYQSISWFWDLYKRQLLDLNPPYQRRSVWNQEYKDYFVDTILNNYPAPAIFLYQEITPDGISKFSVVDGKQRLSTIFEFVENSYPVGDDSSIARLKGKYFKDLNNQAKGDFWKYQFAVEYLESADEKVINNVFDRINRNVAKLTPQELRHARFAGEFIVQAEELAAWMIESLPKNFPVIGNKSVKQMKDVEITAQLLLLLEEGPRSYSQEDLDKVFSDRDTIWEAKDEVTEKFRATIRELQKLTTTPAVSSLAKTRLKNQADFYSLFGAIADLIGQIDDENRQEVVERLVNFIVQVDNEADRKGNERVSRYFDAARSSSNDTGPRRIRIEIIKSVILAQPWISKGGL